MGWINFPVVAVTAERTVKCKCGKTAKRRKKFECAINPFNKNDDGTQKTRDEVRAQAQAHADRWEPAAYTCKSCAAVAGGDA